ncbi:TetR/AcrR family transcriptional regulator [Actinokineospora fastidiosa]|uniref:TetR family transcriptional regulator n=1 Tax=Actinokineospora fastidiosa TaxID=1816 RepID=A0A918LD93_9PSEU|nr:TetR/AcrR family transcriptional regulator [Actinokineospora fastidiosa]GGS31494.1 TetR family transcriptional regulator [Actinokineospora fastidiosa]
MQVDTPVRERVMRAAISLFAAKGFGATSIREIADAAGVTKGGVYHYFESKDDLLFEVYTRMLRMQTSRMRTMADDDSLPLPQRLHAIVADVVETSIANLEEAVVFFQSVHLLAADRQDQVRAERRAYQDRVRDLVAEGQATGVFRTDVPADLIVNYHLGAIHRLGSWYRADGPLTAEQVGTHFADLMLASLRP